MLKKIAKKIAKGMLASLIAVLLIFALGLAFIQTDTGKQQLLQLLEAPLQAVGVYIDKGIQGTLPFHFTIPAIHFEDKQGTYLVINDISWHFIWQKIWNNSIEIAQLEVKKIHLQRLPELEQNSLEEVVENSGIFPQIPEKLPLPEHLPRLFLDNLALQQIIIDKPVLGTAIELKLTAKVVTLKQVIRLQSKLTRLDKKGLSLSLDTHFTIPKQHIALTLKLQEQSGLLPSITQQATLHAVNMSLTGKGTLHDWKGQLDTQLEPLLSVSNRIHITGKKYPALALQSDLQLQAPYIDQLVDSILPLSDTVINRDIWKQQRTALRTLLTPALHFDIAAKPETDEQLHIQRLVLQHPNAQMSGESNVNISSRQLNSQLQIELKALDDWLKAFNIPLSGSFATDITVEGDWLQPKVRLALEGKQLAFQDISMAIFSHVLTAQFNSPVDQGLPAISIMMQGKMKEVSGLPVQEKNIAWDSVIRLDNKQQLKIKQLKIAGKTFELRQRGSINLNTLEGQLKGKLKIPDIAHLLTEGILPYPLQGIAQLKTAFILAPQLKNIDFSMQANVDNLQGLPTELQNIVGTEDINVALNGRLQPTQRIQIEQLHIQAETLNILADATVGLDTQQTLKATLSGQIPDLSILSAMAKVPVQGRVNIDTQVAGSVSRPLLHTTITAKDVKYDQMPITQAQVSIEAENLIVKPKGSLKLAVQQAARDVAIASNFLFDEKILTLSDMDLQAPKTQVTGNIVVDTRNTLVSGKVQGTIQNLRHLAPELQIDGKGTIQVLLSHKDMQQNVKATVQTEDLQGDFGRIAAININILLKDILQQLKIDGKIQLQGFAQNATTIQQLKVHAKGDLQQLYVTTDVEGQAGDSFDIHNQIKMDLDQVPAIVVQNLKGNIAKQPLLLSKPFTIVLKEKDIQVSAIDLSWSKMQLSSTSVILSEHKLASDVHLNIPLKMLEGLTGKAVSGIMKIDISLRGSGKKPAIHATLLADNVILAELKDTLAAGKIETNIHLNGQKLLVDMRIEKVTQQPFLAHFDIPLDLSVQPFHFALKEQHPLQGYLKGKIDLAKFTQLLPLEEQKIAGILELHYQLHGTVKKPDITGELQLQKGLYENAEMGTLLHDMQLLLVMQDQTLQLQTLTFNDGEKGNITGTGNVYLGKTNIPYDINIDIASATLVRRDDITATMGGKIEVAGNTQQAKIKSHLVLEKVDVLLPEPGVSIDELEVEDIRHVKKADKVIENSKQDAGFKALLDIVIDIPSQLFVRGYGLDSEWMGNLHIKGDSNAPQVLGAIEVKRGFLDALDRRFIVEQGVVDFDGAMPPIPTLDFTAGVQTRNSKASVNVRGKADDPELSLSSEPSLPQDEIMANILFDRDIKDISAVQAIRLAAMLEQLRSGKAEGMLSTNKLRSGLGLDTLDVGGDSMETGSVKAGKYLTDKVYMQIEEQFSGGTSMSMEYEITPEVKADVEVNSDSSTGVGIFWGKDY